MDEELITNHQLGDFFWQIDICLFIFDNNR